MPIRRLDGYTRLDSYTLGTGSDDDAANGRGKTGMEQNSRRRHRTNSGSLIGATVSAAVALAASIWLGLGGLAVLLMALLSGYLYATARYTRAIARLRAEIHDAQANDEPVELAPRAPQLAELVATVNQLAVDNATRLEAVRRDQREREERILESHRSRRSADAQVWAQAQSLVEKTVSSVVAELREVLEHADEARTIAEGMTTSTDTTTNLSAGMVADANAADTALIELNGALSEVEGVIRQIRTITEQTRMLSLNAQVEAVRVGPLGAGFEVVAQEVRTLAADTATSASEITATTTQIQRTASRVGSTLSAVTVHALAVGDASNAMRGLAENQADNVAQLSETVRRAIERIQTMAQVSSDLDRRVNDRLPVFGAARLSLGGVDYTISLRDISSAGLEASLPDDLALSVGDRCEVTLPDELNGLLLRAQVAWVANRERGSRAGFSVPEGNESLAKLVGHMADRIVERQHLQ